MVASTIHTNSILVSVLEMVLIPGSTSVAITSAQATPISIGLAYIPVADPTSSSIIPSPSVTLIGCDIVQLTSTTIENNA